MSISSVPAFVKLQEPFNIYVMWEKQQSFSVQHHTNKTVVSFSIIVYKNKIVANVAILMCNKSKYPWSCFFFISSLEMCWTMMDMT